MKKNRSKTFDERADQLSRELKTSLDKDPVPSFSATAWRASCDMLAAIAVGLGLGVVVEYSYSVSPWGMILGFLLGSITGLRTVYRRLVKMGYGLGWPLGPKED